ncbi:alpha/beta fold hydrolase [Streptomyces sp. NPDC058000]|uniref:alpha/beta fold hydrolase n=1 Tax=Streptomyces sp. NPDC058000 TaxID=3346299 RepID=UPI0036EFBAB2
MDAANRLRPLLDAVHDTAAEVRGKCPDYFADRPLRLDRDLLGRYGGVAGGTLARLIGDTYGLTVEPADGPEALTAVDRLVAERAAGGPGAAATPAAVPPEPEPEPELTAVPPEPELAAVLRSVAAAQQERDRLDRAAAERIAARRPERTGVMGGVLHYAAAGPRREDAPPVVLLNALGMGPALWYPLMGQLAEEHRVVTWAPRGTAPGSRPLRVRDHAADLEAVLVAEGATACHLVGWCTGPKVAMAFHRRRPDAVRSMVWLHGSFRRTDDTGGREPDTPYERNLEELCRAVAARPTMADTLRRIFDGGGGTDPAASTGAGSDTDPDTDPETDPHRFAEEVLARPARALDEELRRPFATGPALAAYARQLLDYWADDALAHAPQVRVPVLCVGAAYDRIASPERLAAAVERFPDARYRHLAGATHHSMHDRPREIAGLLTAFLRAVEPIGAPRTPAQL